MTELLLNVLAFLRKTGLVDFLRPFFEFQERLLATTVIFLLLSLFCPREWYGVTVSVVIAVLQRGCLPYLTCSLLTNQLNDHLHVSWATLDCKPCFVSPDYFNHILLFPSKSVKAHCLINCSSICMKENMNYNFILLTFFFVNCNRMWHLLWMVGHWKLFLNIIGRLSLSWQTCQEQQSVVGLHHHRRPRYFLISFLY